VKTIAPYLKQNTPNPFTQNTTIQYYLRADSRQGNLVIYGMDGRQVKSYALGNGMNQVIINAGSLPAGQYIYSLIIDGKKTDTKNMMLTR
ncbi:MAG: T9SS type A sorting domain-containing protein, partial [Panacibacter sp.]